MLSRLIEEGLARPYDGGRRMVSVKPCDDIALRLFGVIPAGRMFGMQVFVDPMLPNDRIRFVDPATGRYSDFPFPE